MPRASNHIAITRQWEMLKRLPSRPPGITAGELKNWLSQNGYPVSKRTVERDLNELSRVFGICCNDKSMPYGWHWVESANIGFGGIHLTDAVSLNLAEQLLKKLLPPNMIETLQPKFDQARKKLDSLEHFPTERLAQKVRYVPNGFELQPPRLQRPILSNIQEALVREKQILARYARFNDDPVERTFNPLSLVQRGATPYLIASSASHAEPRIYAIHRFETAQQLERNAIIPHGFSIDKFIEQGFLQFGRCEVIKMKAKLSHVLATHLTETPISGDQAIHNRDGQWLLEATVQDTWQFHFWILSQGPNIEISEPVSCREKISRSLKEAYLRYSE